MIKRITDYAVALFVIFMVASFFIVTAIGAWVVEVLTK